MLRDDESFLDFSRSALFLLHASSRDVIVVHLFNAQTGIALSAESSRVQSLDYDSHIITSQQSHFFDAIELA